MRPYRHIRKFILATACLNLILGSGLAAFASVERPALERSLSESSAVVRAIDHDDQAWIQNWLQTGHSPLASIRNKLHEHLLDRAASHGSSKVFDTLLSTIDRQHLHAKLADSRGTPLLVGLASLAVPQQKKTARYERMIEDLLRFSPKLVNETDRAYIGDGRTALHEAAANGNLQVIHTLIAHGAKVDARNSTGETPLHLAARFGHINAVRYLLFCHANFHLKTYYTKATPLMAAAEMGQAPVIRLLMAAGANKEERDIFGKTPPDRYKEYAGNYYKHLELAKRRP